MDGGMHIPLIHFDEIADFCIEILTFILAENSDLI